MKIEASSGKLHTKTALWGGLVPANAHKPEVRAPPRALHAAGMRSNALHRPRCQKLRRLFTIHAELAFSPYHSILPFQTPPSRLHATYH